MLVPLFQIPPSLLGPLPLSLSKTIHPKACDQIHARRERKPHSSVPSRSIAISTIVIHILVQICLHSVWAEKKGQEMVDLNGEEKFYNIYQFFKTLFFFFFDKQFFKTTITIWSAEVTLFLCIMLDVRCHIPTHKRLTSEPNNAYCLGIKLVVLKCFGPDCR